MFSELVILAGFNLRDIRLLGLSLVSRTVIGVGQQGGIHSHPQALCEW